MKKYLDLFEDEVAEVLRSAAPDSIIRSGFVSWRPARMLNDDGIYSSSPGYFTQYIDGVRSGTVSASALISMLSHRTFTVE